MLGACQHVRRPLQFLDRALIGVFGACQHVRRTEAHLLPLSEHVLHRYLNRQKPAAAPERLLKLKHATPLDTLK
jgi:hypothetical protein